MNEPVITVLLAAALIGKFVSVICFLGVSGRSLVVEGSSNEMDNDSETPVKPVQSVSTLDNYNILEWQRRPKIWTHLKPRVVPTSRDHVAQQHIYAQCAIL